MTSYDNVVIISLLLNYHSGYRIIEKKPITDNKNLVQKHMGIGTLFSSMKNKARDVTMDKVLERMRDLKLPVSQRKINKKVSSHINGLADIKSANVAITRSGFEIKVSFHGDHPTIKRKLAFVELIWTSHKRSFVFEPDTSFDYLKDQATYACVVSALAAVLMQLLSFTDKKLKDETFSKEIGPVTGVMEKDGKLYYDIRRIPLLRQYAHYRIMGQAIMEHLNVIDCWCENGKMVVRIDNNKLVDQIKNMNIDPATMRKMMKGDMSDFTGEEQ